MRNKLFYILYAIIVIVLFIFVIFIQEVLKIPFLGSMLGLSLGMAMSRGLISDLVESIILIYFRRKRNEK